jgi:hypothetical protein
VSGGLQPRWLLMATIAAIVAGVAIAVWWFGTLAAGTAAG